MMIDCPPEPQNDCAANAQVCAAAIRAWHTKRMKAPSLHLPSYIQLVLYHLHTCRYIAAE
eukprot:3358214-Amphidinium_carterae.1